MKSPNFPAPIPGMSLTAEPKSRPWQKPPQYTEVEEVVDYYLSRMADPKSVSKTNYMLGKKKMPVTNIVDVMITTGMMKGIHTVAMGQLVAPVLSEFIMANAELDGVKYYKTSQERLEGRVSDPIEQEMILDEVRKARAKQMDTAVSLDEMPVSMDMETDMETDMEMPEAGLIARPEPAAPMGGGLMSRPPVAEDEGVM